MEYNNSNFTLYRYRYYIGYFVAAAIVLIGFFVAWQLIPGGLSVGEQKSSVETGALSIDKFKPDMVINLPYHLLQRASFKFFDV